MPPFPRMDPQAMRERTMQFGLQIIDIVDALPQRRAAMKIGDQLVRSGMSVGANYRAATRGRSKAEFVAKLGIVEEEADESAFWLEIIRRKGFLATDVIDPALKEANEILAMTIASIRTARRTADFRKKSAIRNPQSAI